MFATAHHRSHLAEVIIGLMVVVALTLAVASTIHFGVELAGIDDPFPGAALPEAIIAVVVFAGAVAAVLSVPRAWGWALGTTIFAIIGFLVGLRFTLFGGRPIVSGDVVYHLAGLLILIVTAVLLLSRPGHEAFRKG
ncbi:MAG: hypothetical protein EPN30_06500 [Actinomycetota bacterium]|nr:MAG: hypothetical protein EPN30_06500 [Actinomycetota bacterium]